MDFQNLETYVKTKNASGQQSKDVFTQCSSQYSGVSFFAHSRSVSNGGFMEHPEKYLYGSNPVSLAVSMRL